MATRKQFLATLSGLVFSKIVASQILAAPSRHAEGNAIWEEIISVARWCPTVHNLQPHKVKILSRDTAELYYDPARLLPIGDHKSVFATVAMGIFIEYLSIAASKHGKSVVMNGTANDIKADATGLQLFATLQIVDRQSAETLRPELIIQRRTSRLHYDGKPIARRTIAQLTAISEYEGYRLAFTEDEAMVDMLVDLNQDVLFEDLDDDANRNELNGLFRYTSAQAELHKDGLWAECMGFSGRLMQSVMKHHSRWTHGIRRKMLATKYIRSFKGTRTIGWIQSPFTSQANLLKAGTALGRLWLKLTEEGAYMQPFGSLITNERAEKTIAAKVHNPALPGTVWFIFRAGYSDLPARSYRLETKDIIL
jgi:hypothetical protein